MQLSASPKMSHSAATARQNLTSLYAQQARFGQAYNLHADRMLLALRIALSHAPLQLGSSSTLHRMGIPDMRNAQLRDLRHPTWAWTHLPLLVHTFRELPTCLHKHQLVVWEWELQCNCESELLDHRAEAGKLGVGSQGT